MRIYPPKPDTVYYFATCLVDMFYPQAGLCGIKLLEREGIKVVFLHDQTCCGQPAFNSGFRDEARDVAAGQIALFEQDIPIVVPSGSCAGMMRRHWPDLMAGSEWQGRAKAISERVFELTEFLVHVAKIKLQDGGEPVRVTWHSSCHALREMGVTDEPKTLLAQLDNVALNPLQRETECCGFGGTFAVRQPEISAAMLSDKIQDVQNSDAEVVLSGDCGCLMNISGGLEKQNAHQRGQHIAEFLWARTSDAKTDEGQGS